MNLVKKLGIVSLIGFTLISTSTSFAKNPNKIEKNNTVIEVEKDNSITPFDLEVRNGTIRNEVDFEKTYKLSKSNGKNINFWIKNNGTNSVRITINGKHGKTFGPGKSGHITAPAGFFTKNYTFKAVPTPSGGRISIDYRIAQRDQ